MSLVFSRWSLAIKSRGFTLIELMVAISIVSIISAVGLVGYGQAQKYARDARRKQDLKSIQLALELYKQVNNIYPTSYADATTKLVPTYIAAIPTDPKSVLYGYFSNSASCGSYAINQFYYLTTTLENDSDAERNQVKQYKSCDGNLVGAANNLYVVSNNQ